MKTMTNWEKKWLKDSLIEAMSVLDTKYEIEGRDWDDIDYFIYRLWVELEE